MPYKDDNHKKHTYKVTQTHLSVVLCCTRVAESSCSWEEEHSLSSSYKNISECMRMKSLDIL